LSRNTSQVFLESATGQLLANPIAAPIFATSFSVEPVTHLA
jgi:hypothetical protein